MSMEFSRPEYWSGQPFPSSGDLPNPGIEPTSLELQVDSLSSEPSEKPTYSSCSMLSCCSRFQIFATPWIVAHQAPLSMGFSGQEYWRGLSFPPLGDLPNPGIKPLSPVSLALAGGFFTTEPPGKPRSTLIRQGELFD